MKRIIPTESLQMTIAYLYLLSFCPPEYIWHFKQAGEPLRLGLANQAGLSEEAFFAKVRPEACRRIVAFHQGVKEPDIELVTALNWAARDADSSPEAADHFSHQMNRITNFLIETRPKIRLCHQPGFKINPEACRYLFFVLVSDPNYDHLQQLLEAEGQKAAEEQDPVNTVWAFAMGHLWRTLGTKQAYISAEHLGNLAYCLLTVGMHKSRYLFPEKQMQAFHQANQLLIENWHQDNVMKGA